MADLVSQSYLLQFSAHQLLLAMLVFVWSGFVRSSLGFGGAALGLPLMLLIDDSPLFWLPVIGAHLLAFSGPTLINRLGQVDWRYLKKSLFYILPAKIAGVLGLLNLPNQVLVLIIYAITMTYALMWLLNISIRSSGHGWREKLLLGLGGYVSGTTLSGAPMIVAVYMQHVNLQLLRNTLFVLWFFLVTIKMGTFVAFGFNLYLVSAILLLPAAAVGHIVGLKAHEYMLRNDVAFRRILGGVLCLICLLGFYHQLA